MFFENIEISTSGVIATSLLITGFINYFMFSGKIHEEDLEKPWVFQRTRGPKSKDYSSRLSILLSIAITFIIPFIIILVVFGV